MTSDLVTTLPVVPTSAKGEARRLLISHVVSCCNCIHVNYRKFSEIKTTLGIMATIIILQNNYWEIHRLLISHVVSYCNRMHVLIP